MSTAASGQTTAGGVLAEPRASAGLLLVLLGQDAMRRLRTALTAHDLTPRQFQLLALLQDHGAMGQRELGQAMSVAPSILVTLLNPLEADGDVSRDRDTAELEQVLTDRSAIPAFQDISVDRVDRSDDGRREIACTRGAGSRC